MSEAPQHYRDAAHALLDEHGPATPGLGMSMAAMAAATGMSRSSIYRHWPSVQDLDHDLAVHAVVDLKGWQRRLLTQPAGSATEVALAATIDAEAEAEAGLWARTTLAAWPPGSAVRLTIATWERGWLAHLAAWIGDHLAERGRRPRDVGADVAALALAALVEGHLVLDRIWSRPDEEGWYTGRHAHLAASGARLLTTISEPGPTPPPAGGRDPLPESAIPETKRRRLDDALAAVHLAAFGEPAAPTPSRLVDPARLARRLGVTERRIFDVWPTATSANADVVMRLALEGRAQYLDFVDDLLGRVHMGADRDAFDHETVEALARYLRSTVMPGHANLLQCTTALRDPEVRDAPAAKLALDANAMRRSHLAILGIDGDRLRPEVSVDEHFGTVRAALLGIQRLMFTHPDLLDAETTYRGRTQPLCGVVVQIITRSLLANPPGAVPA